MVAGALRATVKDDSMRRLPLALTLASLALGLAACGGGSAPPPAPAAPPPHPSHASHAAAGLPLVDIDKAKAAAEGAADVLVLEFPRDGSRNIRGRITGDSAPAYAVAVAAGQTLRVMFKSPINAATINVVDVANPGEAVHRGEVQGNNVNLKAPGATTYVIVPFQMRSASRRATVANYTVTVHRN